jgi:hypothetical protein
MTRRLPPPWRAEKFSGGYIVRDANGFAVAYVYGPFDRGRSHRMTYRIFRTIR